MDVANTTTTTAAVLVEEGMGKDILLIIASVAMAGATLLLIIIVKLLERCLPADQSVKDEALKKEERVKSVISEHTVLSTYKDWVLAERLKHSQVRQATEAPSSEAVGQQKTDPSVIQLDAIPNELEAGESIRLSSSPKEEEPWATDCAVCLAEFSRDESIRELPCDHIFHDTCIYSWFIKARVCACPLCRHTMQPSAPGETAGAEQLTTQPIDNSGSTEQAAPMSALPRPVDVV